VSSLPKYTIKQTTTWLVMPCCWCDFD